MKIEQKIITSIIISLVAIVIVIFVAILPFQKKNIEFKDSILDSYSFINDQQIIRQNILKNHQEYENLDQSKIDYIFLQSGNPLYLINVIEEIAFNNNCLLTIKLSEPVQKDGIEEIQIDLNLQGSFNNLLATINEIEKQNFYLNYTTVALAKATNSTKLPNYETPDEDLTLNMVAITYWK